MAAGGRLESFFTVPSGVTVSATNSGGGPTSVSITAGSYTITSFIAHLVVRLNAVRTPANWSGSVSTGASGTGLVTLNCTGTWALTFTTAEVGTVLGFVGDIGSRSSAATGTQNARGLWLPNCPAVVELDPLSAPKVTDSRSAESPLGLVITYKGTSKRVHKMLSYSHVERGRVFESSATTTYASLQQWLDDTQYGDGHTWFTPGSAFQVYWDNSGTDVLLGYELNSNAGPTYGWAFSPAISDLSEHVRRVDAGWLGQLAVNFPRLVSRG